MRIKLDTLNVNDMTTIPLVVTSAVGKQTKTKKDYLDMDFTDGTTTINGKYWDWSGAKVPPINSILNVECQVTEYQGVRQLNIKSLTTNLELHLADFTPSSNHDLSSLYKEAFDLTSNIKNQTLRLLGLEALEQFNEQWLTIPAAKTMHHAYTGGVLVHSLSVAKLAKDMARNIPEADEELAFIGGLLHDLGKLFGYELKGVAIELTYFEMLHGHLYTGALVLDRLFGNLPAATSLGEQNASLKLLSVLQHILLSHHGTLEHGAVVVPACIEAHIVHHADVLDAAAEMIRTNANKAPESKFTDRIWALGNQPHLTPNYIKNLTGVDYNEADINN